MGTEKRLIDANALKKKKTILWDEALGFSDCVLVEDLDNEPTLEAVEVVHGRWISTEEKPHLIYRCSECGDKWSYGAMLHCKYCPNCGAKMDGDGNG